MVAEKIHLIIDGISYTINDLGKLPSDIAAYQAAQRSNEDTIVFQGEPSPWSNFHTAPFVINNQCFNTSEHWIQLQKALMFNDLDTADKILNCTSPHEAKKLGYQVQGMDVIKWKEKGYHLCLEGVKGKIPTKSRSVEYATYNITKTACGRSLRQDLGNRGTFARHQCT